jgi:hypothetical protein
VQVLGNLSKFELAGGNIMNNVDQGTGIVTLGSVQVKITSGTISMLGPDSDGVALTGAGQLEVLGGTITASRIGVSGFSFPTIAIHGGTIRGGLEALRLGNRSQLHIFGGLLGDMDGGTDLRIDGGTARFYGHSFKLNGVPVGPGLIMGPGASVGRLTGILQNGEPLDIGIDVHVEGIPNPDDPARVFLVLEPCGLAILCCAMVWGAIGRRTRFV